MQYAVIGGIILLAVIIIFTSWRVSTNWKVVYEDTVDHEGVLERFSMLQDEGVRCRVRHTGATAAPTASASLADHQASEKIEIEAHKEDIEKAQQLLSNYKPSTGFNI